MNIIETVFNLQKIFDEMEQTFNDFQRRSGLLCLPGCGKCCLFPDIETSILECLPLALKIYREGRLDEWIARAEKADSICLAWDGNRETGKGRCSEYTGRPAVCRMFGASGYFDKNHSPSLSVCKLIKENYPELMKKITEDIAEKNPPIMAHWYARIQGLGNGDIMLRRPVNQSILGALQLVGFYAQYQELTYN